MQLEIGSHLVEAELEQYSMGKLPESRLEPFEEHFLACDSCQDRLLEMEAYVNAVRSVSPKLRVAHPSPKLWATVFIWPRPAWVAVAALSLIGLTVGRVWIIAPGEPPMVAVLLHASRGVDGLAVANAPAGKPVSFHLDLTELPSYRAYRIEIVDSMGKRVWEAVTVPREGKIAQPMSKGLSAGRYYVRLYDPSGELLREFGLRAD